MPSFCAVANCTDRYNHADNVSFHKFPLKRIELLQQWEAFIQQQRGPNWRASRWSSLCSRHFREDDFKSFNERKTLKKTAVPSVLCTVERASKICLNDDVSDSKQKEIMAIKERLEDVGSGPKSNCRLCGIACAMTITFNYELYCLVEKCFPTLNIQQEETLPKVICGTCKKNVLYFGEFAERVWNAQAELQRKFKTRVIEKPLKIKQEPIVGVKQEVAEYGFEQQQHQQQGALAATADDSDILTEAVHEDDPQVVEQKYEFCDFPLIDCDIMEIINLDDPYINIPDDDNTNVTNDVSKISTVCSEVMQYTPSAHELLQERLLMEEHNYACIESNDFKEERQVYKTEKSEAEERNVAPLVNTEQSNTALAPIIENTRGPASVITEEAFVDGDTNSCEKRALKPIVTSVSEIQQPSKVKNIIVLNESIVNSGEGFKLHECMMCPMKFFSIESLRDHYTPAHGTPMVTMPPEALEVSAMKACKMEKEVIDAASSHDPIPSMGATYDAAVMHNGQEDIMLSNNINSSYINEDVHNVEAVGGQKKLQDMKPQMKINKKHSARLRFKLRKSPNIYLSKVAFQYQHLKSLYKRLQKKCTNLEQNFEQLQTQPPQQRTTKNNSKKAGGQAAGGQESLTVERKTADKTVTCPLCPKTFSNMNSLRQHKITHSEERKHECNLCNRTFKRRNGLAQHLRGFHLQVKPYACSVCSHSYALKCDMLRCKHSTLKIARPTE